LNQKLCPIVSKKKSVSCRDHVTSVSAVTVCVSTRISERITNYPVSRL